MTKQIKKAKPAKRTPPEESYDHEEVVERDDPRDRGFRVTPEFVTVPLQPPQQVWLVYDDEYEPNPDGPHLAVALCTIVARQEWSLSTVIVRRGRTYNDSRAYARPDFDTYEMEDDPFGFARTWVLIPTSRIDDYDPWHQLTEVFFSEEAARAAIRQRRQAAKRNKHRPGRT